MDPIKTEDVGMQAELRLWMTCVDDSLDPLTEEEWKSKAYKTIKTAVDAITNKHGDYFEDVDAEHALDTEGSWEWVPKEKEVK